MAIEGALDRTCLVQFHVVNPDSRVTWKEFQESKDYSALAVGKNRKPLYAFIVSTYIKVELMPGCLDGSSAIIRYSQRRENGEAEKWEKAS